MASEPYTAEAPPVMMSTRSTSAVGMIEVSTRPLKLYGVRRLPSIRIRLRCAPRPRRLIVAAPAVPLLAFWPSDGAEIGRMRTILSTSGCCSSSDFIGANREDRAGGLDAGQRDARARDDHLFKLFLFLGDCGRARNGASQKR